MSIYSKWDKIENQWVKWGIAILIFGISAIIIFSVIKWIKRSKRKDLFKSDYDNLIASGQKPSYPDTSYLQMADKIYEAGCSGLFCIGTDEESILSVFNQMNNELDVLLLARGFGTRTPRGEPWGTGVDLGGFLQTELSGDDIDTINNTLKSKGIKYRF